MRWLAFLLLTVVTFIVAPFLVIPFAIAQRVPWWMNTPDDPDLEKQGLYEPQVKWWYDRFGQRVKTWYWLGWRNQMYGLFWRLSVHAPEGATRYYSVPDYPKGNPFTPGFCHVTMTVDGTTFHEWNWVWAYSSTKYGQIRVGWKLAEMDIPGPIAFCFQPKLFPLTRG